MGLNLKDLVVREKTTLEAFSTKVIAIDAYNAIYQFLASIRGPDGLQLTDSEGRITSHLSGLLYRNVNFLSLGIKPVYVFDGKPPSLKTAEIERRKQTKKDATVKYEKAIAEGNMEDARKFAQQTTSMKDGMVKESKKFLTYFGIPYIDAPSEGEATAAHLTNTGQAYASASQDYDSILCGAKRLVRNFTSSGRRKIPNRNTYIDVLPEIIETQKVWQLDYFFFVDSVFNFPTNHACAICEEIIRREVKIKWYANVNPVGISDEMASLMARSGCIGADVGIDVASAEMLQRMGKGFTQTDIAKASACYRKAGIATSFQLLLGGPGETRDTIIEGFKFLEGIPQPDNILTVFGIRIYPNTPLFEVARPEDIVFMGEKGDYLSPTFHLPHDFTQNDFQMVEDWCKQYPHWSTPLNPWQYFNVMRATRAPKFGKFKIKQ